MLPIIKSYVFFFFFFLLKEDYLESDNEDTPFIPFPAQFEYVADTFCQVNILFFSLVLKGYLYTLSL